MSVHRIPFGRQGLKPRGPVLIHHGFLGSSDSWILRDANEDLGKIAIHKILNQIFWYSTRVEESSFTIVTKQSVARTSQFTSGASFQKKSLEYVLALVLRWRPF